MLVYLDTTALRRLSAWDERSAALTRYLGSDPTIVSCRIVEAGLVGDPILAAVAMREIDSTLLQSVSQLKPSTDIELEAGLHLAAANQLRRELEGFVTYDERIAAAARALRLPVVMPI
jgi:hypothetical protein